MDRISRDQLHANILAEISKRGSCKRLQVGALLINDNRIISMGYNGPVKGDLDCTDINCDLEHSCLRAIHAEQNILANCAKHGISTNGTTIWVEFNPCPACARLLVQAGIREVVYIKEFRDVTGITILRSAGIIIRKYGELPL
jgi:dCMP deaminase